jgi:hypothetical protein
MERPVPAQDKRHRQQPNVPGPLGREQVPEKASAGHAPKLCRL